MISVVNGYVCTSSCEAASARAGKDPSAVPGTPPGQSGETGKPSGFAGQLASVLGGALKDLAAANGSKPAGHSTPANQPLLNQLA